MPGTDPLATRLRTLTFEDLEAWAGARILQRGRNYIKQVQHLSRTQENALAAWVTGTRRYATWIRPEGTELQYFCTCPYNWNGPCKHAVAVVLAAAEAFKEKRTLPLLDESDELNRVLEEEALACAEGETGLPASGNQASDRIGEILNDKSREELLELLLDIARSHPEIRQELLETEQLARGEVARLVQSLHREIRDLTAEPAWYDPWRETGELPDYSHLERQLRALAQKGHADALLELGDELWSRGTRQVEQSDDEGETALAIAGCLERVLEALPKSSLTPPQQLLWIIERQLEDEYGLLGSSEDLLKRRQYTRTHWSEVAQALETRLKTMNKPTGKGFTATYRRSWLLDQLIDAHARAGEEERIIPRLEAEADSCRCYGALVERLLEAGDLERARYWCIHGYEQTIAEQPGIAHSLQKHLRKIAQKERRYDLVAAYRAREYLDRPTKQGYEALRKAAEKARCWPAVRSAILDYLETGIDPTSDSEQSHPTWPLPRPEVVPPAPGKRARFRRFPDLDTLIGIAILEQRPDDVVALHQRRGKRSRMSRETDRAVAKAVEETHPDVALAIWQEIAEELIAQVKPRAYLEAAPYLKMMKQLYSRNDRSAEWNAYLQALRTRHKAKRRLMEVLDTLSGRKLID